MIIRAKNRQCRCSSLTQSGTFTVTALDGVTTLTVGGIAVVTAGVAAGFPQSITTPLGSTLTITVNDGQLNSAPVTSVVNVVPVNDAPVVAAPIPAQSIVQDGSLSFTVPAGTFTDPDGDTLIEPGDEVFFLAATEHIRTVMTELRKMDQPVRRVMIAGGGQRRERG